MITVCPHVRDIIHSLRVDYIPYMWTNCSTAIITFIRTDLAQCEILHGTQMLVGKTNFGLLQGLPMLLDKTNFGLVLYNHANFYRFEYWSVKRISVFLCFSLVNQRHTSGFTVYNRTVANIENTVRAMHSCSSWFQA